MANQQQLEDQIQALSCAVAVLDGTAGGYSKEEKDKAKSTLINMNVETQKAWRELMSSSDG